LGVCRSSFPLKILALEKASLSEHEIILLRLAAILHDIARLDEREKHAESSAKVVEKWLQEHSDHDLKKADIAKILEMVADHSNKEEREQDFCKAVLKDADTLDEIGVMSIFMTSNWLQPQSPFFFHDLRKRLLDVELPFCDQKLAILNTNGAKEILRAKRAFVENFIAQLSAELDAEADTEQLLFALSKTAADQRPGRSPG
jgi:uncharacterized protein